MGTRRTARAWVMGNPSEREPGSAVRNPGAGVLFQPSVPPLTILRCPRHSAPGGLARHTGGDPDRAKIIGWLVTKQNSRSGTVGRTELTG